MQEHQNRVIVEHTELQKKIVGLFGFINSEEFENVDIAEQGRLRSQINHMRSYSNILFARIAEFK